MTKQQVFEQITSAPDWWNGFCSRSYATQIRQRFEDGRLSEKTIDKMFAHYGYVVSIEKEWDKKTSSCPVFTSEVILVDRKDILTAYSPSK